MHFGIRNISGRCTGHLPELGDGRPRGPAGSRSTRKILERRRRASHEGSRRPAGVRTRAPRHSQCSRTRSPRARFAWSVRGHHGRRRTGRRHATARGNGAGHDTRVPLETPGAASSAAVTEGVRPGVANSRNGMRRTSVDMAGDPHVRGNSWQRPRRTGGVQYGSGRLPKSGGRRTRCRRGGRGCPAREMLVASHPSPSMNSANSARARGPVGRISVGMNFGEHAHTGARRGHQLTEPVSTRPLVARGAFEPGRECVAFACPGAGSALHARSRPGVTGGSGRRRPAAGALRSPACRPCGPAPTSAARCAA